MYQRTVSPEVAPNEPEYIEVGFERGDAVSINGEAMSPATLLETLNKNTSLIDIGLTGNRFSHSCLAKIKKITSRNIKMIEEHEPNKLKAEIYKLRYEYSKLQMAKTKLDQQKNEIEKVKKVK